MVSSSESVKELFEKPEDAHPSPKENSEDDGEAKELESPNRYSADDEADDSSERSLQPSLPSLNLLEEPEAQISKVYQSRKVQIKSGNKVAGARKSDQEFDP